MYTVIRTYTIFPNTIEDFIQDVQENLLPILRQIPGFRAYYLVEVGDYEAAVISIFDSLESAKVSAQQTMDWIGKHPELYFQGFSKPIAGHVRVLSEPARLSPTSVEELQGCF